VRRSELNPAFVTAIPDTLDQGTIYISMTYGTALHKCCCGCGQEVVTPLSPTDWTLHFDGERITLDPSIGNWSFACQSHYWIRKNRVIWAKHWTPQEIEQGRRVDHAEKQQHYSQTTKAKPADKATGRRGLWTTILSWFRKQT